MQVLICLASLAILTNQVAEILNVWLGTQYLECSFFFTTNSHCLTLVVVELLDCIFPYLQLRLTCASMCGKGVRDFVYDDS